MGRRRSAAHGLRRGVVATMTRAIRYGRFKPHDMDTWCLGQSGRLAMGLAMFTLSRES
jgi:hypothetical protein